MSQPQADTVLAERHTDGHVVELAMNRPAALNAISTAQAEAIVIACSEIAADESLRAVVLTSRSDRAFCVGADLKERNSFSDDQLLAQRPRMRAAFGAICDLAVPTIAAVHGYALGGGCELALACDLIVADGTAVFGLPEVTVGLVPGGGGTQLLRRRLGWSRAADLIFTGRRVDAAEAEWLGLIDRLVQPGSAQAAALDLAGTIAANSPVGVRQAKWALTEGADAPLADGLEMEDRAWRTTALSSDRQEGIAAFNDKRRPQW